jgi:hypothetical protein
VIVSAFLAGVGLTLLAVSSFGRWVDWQAGRYYERTLRAPAHEPADLLPAEEPAVRIRDPRDAYDWARER